MQNNKAARVADKTQESADVGAMFRDFAVEIRSYLTALCGDIQQAEDLTQVVFVKIMDVVQKKGHIYGDPRNLAFRLAHNTYVDYVRRSSAGDRMLASCRERLPAFDRLRDDRSEEIIAVLIEFIGRTDIPERRREILKLRFLDGFSVRDIHKAVGLSKPTVYREMQYGARDLRESYRSAGLEPGILRLHSEYQGPQRGQNRNGTRK